ncbi:Fumarate hydratase class II [Candidatus Calditenuaceae archaeon HR02]|nr:Fumarate hydratase class II [Candidatus Calditenuaceae archaeon HR02]
MKPSDPEYRVEKDTMGEMRVPVTAYYGAQTARALENFKFSQLTMPRQFIKALGLIKAGAAKANTELGLLPKHIGDAIYKAALEVAEGLHDDQFVVDVFQTGSGTSTNMNANEVIANRASELLGGRRGDKMLVHPNDHVNMGQSTNDVIPTAIRVAVASLIHEKLLKRLDLLASTLELKAQEFRDVVKSGRTHLQDAVPVTLGQEFSAYAEMMRKSVYRVRRASEGLLELPIGGTAVGTSLNAHPEFAPRVVKFLSETLGIPFVTARNRFEAMGSQDACVEVSGTLRCVAGSILKICNDLRLLSSGPVTGFGEIEIPAVQPGSSIMPGKVNPVIVEASMLAACMVIGYDAAIFEASRVGELELNMGNPLIAYCLINSVELLSRTAQHLADKVIPGITANVERCRLYAESSPATITVLAPLIGYDKAAEIARRAMGERRSIKDIVVEMGLMSREEIDKVFDVKRMTEGGILVLKREQAPHG